MYLRVILIVGLFLAFTSGLYAQCAEEYELYQVSGNDSFRSIADYYGSDQFLEILITENSFTGSPDSTLPRGMVVKVPAGIAAFETSNMELSEVLNDPFCTGSNDFQSPLEQRDSVELQPDSASGETENERLEQFREAFQALIESQADTVDERRLQQAEEQILMEIDGLVVDETRSKIGKDFYDVFYQRWEAPENASNFTVRISERPTPTLGSFVSVSVNDNLTFQYRLQPRYDIIETAAIYAVRMTQQYLANNQQTYRIY